MKKQAAVGAISIPPWLAMTSLALPAALLLVASTVQNILFFQAENPDPATKLWLLDVNFERSIFTWYSSVLHLCVAALLFLTALEKARLKDRFTYCWAGLAPIFVFTAMDETLALHERLESLGGAIAGNVAPGAAWVVPAVAACVIGLALAIPFLRNLPRPFPLLMLASAALFVGGAAGLEAIEGELFFRHGLKQTFAAEMFAAVEEAMEVAGLLLFIHTLLLYRRRHMMRMMVRIG